MRLNPHPGVSLLRPQGKHGWRAKYVDPWSERVKRVTIPDIDAASPEAREAWAKRLADTIAQERRKRDDGKHAPIDQRLDDAAAAWLKSEAWSDRTVEIYRSAAEELIACWGPGRIVRRLGVPDLEAFRAWARVQRVKHRGKRATNTASGTRDLNTVNHVLVVAGIFLRYARRVQGLELHRDEITDSLRPFKLTRERKTFLQGPAIATLLRLARQHEPHAYPAIRCLLLTGLRAGELFRLNWAWVQDGDRIMLPGAAVKTRQYRDVDLSRVPHALPPRPAGVASGLVFGDITRQQLRFALARLREREPVLLAGLSAHMLRRTCATYFTNSVDAWQSAKSLGHSVVVAEKSYAGLVKGIKDAPSLEHAMGVVELLAPPAPAAQARKPRKDMGTTRRTAAA